MPEEYINSKKGKKKKEKTNGKKGNRRHTYTLLKTVPFILCIMKSHQLLRCIFPDVLADYFDVVDIQESVSQFDFWLDERNFMEKSDHKLGTVSSYGFTSERVIQDFPIRGKAVYLHVRRRKWRDSSNGEIFTYSYDDLTAEGSKLSPEFVSFLKE